MPAKQPKVLTPDDFKSMTAEQVRAYLQQRQADLLKMQKEAKKVGVDVTKKVPKDDLDRIEWLFNRLGYQTGMRLWADGMLRKYLARLQAITHAVATDPERLGDCLAAAAEGYRDARIGSGFESAAMPEKKTADTVPLSTVGRELFEAWETELDPLGAWFLELVATMPADQLPVAAPKEPEATKPTETEPEDESEEAKEALKESQEESE